MFSTLLTLLITAPPNLANHPDVESVKVAVECDEPRLTIIHIRDWHFLDYDTFKADSENLSPDKLRQQYRKFAKDVEAIQDRQERVLQSLVKAGHTDVWGEGLTPPLEPVFLHLCAAAYQNDLFDSPNWLSVGAVGRLGIDEAGVKVHALDTDESLKVANPIEDDGKLRDVSDAAIEKREEIMLQRLARRDGVAVILLGGGHDLSDNVPAGVRLLVVKVKGYPE